MQNEIMKVLMEMNGIKAPDLSKLSDDDRRFLYLLTTVHALAKIIVDAGICDTHRLRMTIEDTLTSIGSSDETIKAALATMAIMPYETTMEATNNGESEETGSPTGPGNTRSGGDPGSEES